MTPSSQLNPFAFNANKLNVYLQTHFSSRCKTLTYGLLICVFYLAPLPTVAANKNALSKTDLADLQTRISELKKEFNVTQGAHKDAADALKESEQAISVANKKLYEISRQQQQNQKILSKLNAQSGTINSTLAQQQVLLSKQLSHQYMHGQQSYAQLMLQSEHPSQLARDLHYYSYIANARAKLIAEMRTNLDKVAELNDKTAEALAATVALKQKQIDERRTLEQQKREKNTVVRSLSQQMSAQRSEIKKLTRDEKRLSELVTRLAKVIPPARKKTSKPAGKNTSKQTPNKSDIDAEESNTQTTSSNQTVVATNNTLPSNEFSDTSFAALKGKLRLPVRGNVTNRFGSSREDSGISWKGLFISANEGAEVKSVANGRVVFADWLRGFGNLVIVDHGGGYMSLYGNNQAALKQVGDNVSAGDTIASVGNSGGNVSHGLYYELRRQSRPFDPLSWSTLR